MLRNYLIFCVCLLLTGCTLPKLPLYLGKGYNILKGNPMSQGGIDPGYNHQIFQFTYSKGQQTQDGKFLVPDNVSHRKATSCTFSSKISEYRGTQSYQNDLKIKTEISGGYNGAFVKAAFSQSSTYQKMSNITTKQNTTVTQTSASCEAYQLSLNLFNTNKITDNFWMGLKTSYNRDDWRQFIDQFGSHFVYEVVLGGRAVQEIQFDSKTISEFKSLDIDINLAVKASFAKFYSDSSFDYHKYSTQTKYVETFSKEMNELYIGGKPPVNGNISQWQQKIIEDPMPIHSKVMPLSDLFDLYKGTDINIKDAKNKFLLSLDKQCNIEHCKDPVPDFPDPPKPTITQSQSEAHGGNGGGPFQWSKLHPTLNLKKVLIRSGKEIDKIQLFLSDGVTSMYTPQFGGNGGGAAEWTVPDGEHVTQIEYRSGDGLDSVCFITNKGNKSPHYGGSGGSYSLVTFPAESRIIGIYGRSGSRVDKLGFQLATTNFKTGQIQVIRKNLIAEE